MSDIVDRLRAASRQGRLPYQTTIYDDAAAELVRLRLRLSDLEMSIAAFRQTVNEWEW